MADIFMTDFGQEMCTCPHCKNKRVFIQKYARVMSIYNFPFFPTGKGAVALCRSCHKQIRSGEHPEVDMKLSQAVESVQYKKWFYAGAIILSTLLVVGGALSFLWR